MKGIGIKKAFILAGGEGRRLRPLTFEIPKPLIPVHGKPVLEWNIEACKRFGVKEIVLGLGYKARQVKQYCKKNIRVERLQCSVEKEFLGTAGALKNAERFLKKEKKFIMMNGDDCKEIDFAALNEVFEKNNALAAIALTQVDYSQAGGVVSLDGERIVGWEEKPANQQGIATLNSGAYILSNKILDFIPKGETVSIEKQTFPLLIKEGKLFGCNCVNQFFQADTFERYEKAIFGWKGLSNSPNAGKATEKPCLRT